MSNRVRVSARFLLACGCLTAMALANSGCRSERSDVPAEKASEVSDVADTAPAAKLDDLPPAMTAEGDSPWWRGPTLNNHAEAGQDPPLQWSETQNVLWRATLPGRGHGSPCVCGGRIFLPSGDEEKEVIWLLCFDRDSGKQLWRTEVWHGALPKVHQNNSHASATPACDGERVYFPYQTDTEVRMAALNLEGEVVWNETVGPYTSLQGYSASPALHKSAVIVPTDATKRTPHKLTALHRKTGQVIWRVARPDDREGYASPLVAEVAGRVQLFIVGPDKTRSYDPDNGTLLWECDGPTQYNAATVAFGRQMIYATGGYPGKALLAIRADGSGDVTDTHLVWKSDRKAGYVPSPLLADGLLYAVSDTGLMRCYDATSGEVVWQEDLDAKFYSSPVLVGERIYVFDQEAKGYVIKAGRRFELLGENSLPDGAFATPIICGSRIFLRTLGDFYCLAEEED